MASNAFKAKSKKKASPWLKTSPIMMSTSSFGAPFRSAQAPQKREQPSLLLRAPRLYRRRRRCSIASSSSSSSSDWKNFNAEAFSFLRERAERIRRVDAAVESAKEAMPRLLEGEKSISLPLSELRLPPEAAEATLSSSSPFSTSSLRERTENARSAPPPPPLLSSLEAFDDWHAWAWAALGEASASVAADGGVGSSGGGDGGGGAEPT